MKDKRPFTRESAENKPGRRRRRKAEKKEEGNNGARHYRGISQSSFAAKRTKKKVAQSVSRIIHRKIDELVRLRPLRSRLHKYGVIRERGCASSISNPGVLIRALICNMMD